MNIMHISQLQRNLFFVELYFKGTNPSMSPNFQLLIKKQKSLFNLIFDFKRNISQKKLTKYQLVHFDLFMYIS